MDTALPRADCGASCRSRSTGTSSNSGGAAAKLVIEFQSAVHTLLRHGLRDEEQAQQCLAAAVCSLEQLGDVGAGTSAVHGESCAPGAEVTPRHGLLSTSTLQPFLELLLNIVRNAGCNARSDQNVQLAVILLTYVCRYWTVPEASVGFPVQLPAAGARQTPSGPFIQRCWAVLYNVAKNTPSEMEVHRLCKYFYYSVPTIGIADDSDSPSESRSVAKVLQLVPADIACLDYQTTAARSLRVDVAVLHRLAAHLVANPSPQQGQIPGSKFHAIARHLFSILHSALGLGASGTRDAVVLWQKNNSVEHQPVCYLLPPRLVAGNVNNTEPDFLSIGSSAGSKANVPGTSSQEHQVEGCCFGMNHHAAQFPKNVFHAPLWVLAVNELHCHLSHVWGFNDDGIADVIFAQVGTRGSKQERREVYPPAKKIARRQLSNASSDVTPGGASIPKDNPKPHGVLQAVEEIISSSFRVANGEGGERPSTSDGWIQKARAHRLMRGIALWKCLVCLLGRRLCRPAQLVAPAKHATVSPLTRDKHHSHADASTASYAQRYVTAVLRPLAEVTRFLKSGVLCARVFADDQIIAPTECPFNALDSLSVLQHILAAWQVFVLSMWQHFHNFELIASASSFKMFRSVVVAVGGALASVAQRWLSGKQLAGISAEAKLFNTAVAQLVHLIHVVAHISLESSRESKTRVAQQRPHSLFVVEFMVPVLRACIGSRLRSTSLKQSMPDNGHSPKRSFSGMVPPIKSKLGGNGIEINTSQPTAPSNLSAFAAKVAIQLLSKNGWAPRSAHSLFSKPVCQVATTHVAALFFALTRNSRHSTPSNGPSQHEKTPRFRADIMDLPKLLKALQDFFLQDNCCGTDCDLIIALKFSLWSSAARVVLDCATAASQTGPPLKSGPLKAPCSAALKLLTQFLKHFVSRDIGRLGHFFERYWSFVASQPQLDGAEASNERFAQLKASRDCILHQLLRLQKAAASRAGLVGKRQMSHVDMAVHELRKLILSFTQTATTSRTARPECNAQPPSKEKGSSTHIRSPARTAVPHSSVRRDNSVDQVVAIDKAPQLPGPQSTSSLPRSSSAGLRFIDDTSRLHVIPDTIPDTPMSAGSSECFHGEDTPSHLSSGSQSDFEPQQRRPNSPRNREAACKGDDIPESTDNLQSASSRISDRPAAERPTAANTVSEKESLDTHPVTTSVPNHGANATEFRVAQGQKGPDLGNSVSTKNFAPGLPQASDKVEEEENDATQPAGDGDATDIPPSPHQVHRQVFSTLQDCARLLRVSTGEGPLASPANGNMGEPLSNEDLEAAQIAVRSIQQALESLARTRT